MNKGLKRGITLLTATVAIAVVAGCTSGISTNSKIEQGPVGVGRSVNELKGTPCACTEIPMAIPASMKV